MSNSRSRRPGRSVATGVMAVVWFSGVAAVAAAQSPPGGAETAVEAALRRLSETLYASQLPVNAWDQASAARLCELWLAYARAAGLPEKPRDYRQLRASVPSELRGQSDSLINEALLRLERVSYECPPRAQRGSGATETAGTGGGIGGKAVLIGGGVAALGAGIALAAGGGGSSPASPPPATPPPSVTPFHGLYVGRLVTGASIPGCGRAATAACNAQVGGSATGTPASLTFGGDLPSTGVLRPTGAMESFRYEGPANGLAALPGGIVVDWRQQGTIANNMLTLDGTATVTSPGPCNGAVITTRVEATKN